MLDMHIADMHITGMKLNAYMDVAKEREEDFADKIGASQSYVNRLKNGHVWPSAEMARRVMEATNGAVTPNDFLPAPKTQPATTDMVNGRAA